MEDCGQDFKSGPRQVCLSRPESGEVRPPAGHNVLLSVTAGIRTRALGV